MLYSVSTTFVKTLNNLGLIVLVRDQYEFVRTFVEYQKPSM